MEHPWFIALSATVLGLIALSILLTERKNSRHQRPMWVADNEAYLKGTRYRTLTGRLKFSVITITALIAALALVSVLLMGMPVTKKQHRQADIKRDIVLCLDVSGSMIATDRKVIASFRSIVGSFHGERVAFHVWNSSDVTVYPLTDDYSMAQAQLKRVGTLFSQVIFDGQGGVSVTEEFLDFLETTMPDDMKGSSLIADGVASCVLAFPKEAQGRSRTLIVATDNEPMGTSVYTLKQATQLAKARKVKVFGLYNHDPNVGAPADRLSPEEARHQKEEFTKAAQLTGGNVFDVSDSEAIDHILKDIASRGSGEKHKQGRLVTDVKDHNDGFVIALFVLFSAFLLFLSLSRGHRPYAPSRQRGFRADAQTEMRPQ